MTDNYEVDRITVSEDVGSYFPVWKKITLVLWDDGTVTWDSPPSSASH